MAIPPFPPNDLAKLVLGYLAEEQLMTAYDEFLQASPYLDAMRNEYDRMFMTSLRNILAEYRAVKIYIETCKPIALRKRIMQCPSMLEVVKLLISVVDINRLNGHEEVADKKSSSEPIASKLAINCDVCNVSNVVSCICRSKDPEVESSDTEAANLNTSVETTLLSDLPGNTGNDIVFQDNTAQEKIISQSPDSYEDKNGAELNNLNNNVNSEAISSEQNFQPEFSSQQCIAQMKPDESCKSNQEGAETATLSNTTKKRVFIPVKIDRSNIIRTNLTKNTQSFSNFVPGANPNTNENLPSLPKYKIITPQPSCVTKDNATKISPVVNISGPPKVIKTLPAADKSKQINFLCRVSTQPTFPCLHIDGTTKMEQDKNEEQRIKILSDVKVQTTMPQVLKTATSTPIMKTHTIFINGTPAYNNILQNAYTKDEIMAMPTIILMKSDTSKPASTNLQTPVDGPPDTSKPVSINLQTAVNVPQDTSKSVPANLQTAVHAPPELDLPPGLSNRSLEPLIIDVTPDNVSNEPSSKIIESDTDTKKKIETGLLKTVDPTYASLPKDSCTLNQDKITTPNVLPTTRKSSSTPRRSSHIRVLDFNTPRRILSVSNSDTNTISESSKVSLNTIHEEIVSTQKNDNSNVMKPSVNILSKENQTIPKQKKNWDAELRALVGVSNDTEENLMNASFKNKNKNSVKSYVNKKINKSKTKNDVGMKNKPDTDKRHRKKKKTLDKCDEKEKKNVVTVIKPTINIITAGDLPAKTLENNQNQDNAEDGPILDNTPEMDKLALHNVIGGAKLNISDFLETPYKQVLYDIQMETPRFLGPDLPGEPLSDIKIANIPTPRFFDTPKAAQATPSSYSSRPTDYSSGGSYYKPDDNDYIPIEDVLESAETPVTEIPKKNNEKAKQHIENVSKPRRPVRNCTKNVSYRNLSKSRDDESSETNFVCVETDTPKLIKKTGNSRSTPKTNTKNKSNTEKKLKNNSIQKTKTPLKKNTPKNFMKIKPRKLTPIKIGKEKKRTPSNKDILSDLQSRKRTSSKEKIINTTPMIAVAPTKSRRKSTTPRKLHCTKSFNSESGDNHSSDKSKSDLEVSRDDKLNQESDTDHQPLRWSDDGSQDAKRNETKGNCGKNEDDDISKIKEYIETSGVPDIRCGKESDGMLHNDLIKRGFDIETAKIIERDLLDTPPRTIQSVSTEVIVLKDSNVLNMSDKSVNECSNASSQLEEVVDELEDDVELSVSECCDGNDNYISYTFDESNFVPNNNIPKLKDNFTMDIGNMFDDGTSIRLRATSLKLLIDEDAEEVIYCKKETENAVHSICNIERLYTPIKDPRVQCYEIFDSTLTSLDTPLKVSSPKDRENTTVAEIVLEVENIETKDKIETRKRKRISSGLEESVTAVKKTISETQYLLDSASIQNMDIESVLSKLHGP